MIKLVFEELCFDLKLFRISDIYWCPSIYNLEKLIISNLNNPGPFKLQKDFINIPYFSMMSFIIIIYISIFITISENNT